MATEHQFMSWYQSEDETTKLTDLGDTGKWIDAMRNASRQDAKSTFTGLDHLRAATDAIHKGQVVSVSIHDGGAVPQPWEISGKGDFRTDFRTLILSFNPTSVVIKNCTIRHLDMGVPSSIDVQIVNCFIGTLKFRQTPRLLRITDCWIGNWEVSQQREHLYRDVEFVSGGLLNVSCPPPNEPVPFRGSVSFVGTRFSTNRHHLIRGAQPYRNLRAQLAKLENGLAANQLHIAEQKLERQEDASRFNKA